MKQVDNGITSCYCTRVLGSTETPVTYIALCTKSVGNLTPTVALHNTVTERQLFGFDNLCLEKYYLIYLVKIMQQSIHKM